MERLILKKLWTEARDVAVMYDDISSFKIYLVDVGLLRLAQLSPTAFGEGFILNMS